MKYSNEDKNKNAVMYAATSLFSLPLLLPSSFLSVESARQRLAYISFMSSVGTFGASFPADPLCSTVINIINRWC